MSEILFLLSRKMAEIDYAEQWLDKTPIDSQVEVKYSPIFVPSTPPE
jgi:hypothetical protein